MGKGVNRGLLPGAGSCPLSCWELSPLRTVPGVDGADAVDGEDAERVFAVRGTGAAVFGGTPHAPALTLQAAASTVHAWAGPWVPAGQGSVRCSVPYRGSGVEAFEGHGQNWLLNIY